MDVSELIGRLADGLVAHLGREEDLAAISWHPHPSFAGVLMKHLIRGRDTGGLLSCHMVRVDPGRALPPHAHEEQWELHEVLAGAATATLGGSAVAYLPGRITVVPRGTLHGITAGEEGLVMLAKFFPPLV